MVQKGSIYLFLCGIALIGAEGPYPAEIPSNSLNGINKPSASPVYTKWEGEPGDQSFSIQSGYEGYLIPAEPQFSLVDVLKTAGVLTLLPPFAKIGLKLALKLGVWVLGFISLFLLGSLVTTTVCAFTPICSISFLGLGFNKESVRSLISEDKLNMATKFLSDAIHKYKEMNKKKSTKEASQ